MGLSTSRRCSFKRSFSHFSYTLLVTAFALNHVITVFRVAGDVVSKRFCFACGVECVRSKSVGYIGACGTILAL